MTSTDLTTPDDRTMDERARDMTIPPASGSVTTDALSRSRSLTPGTRHERPRVRR